MPSVKLKSPKAPVPTEASIQSAILLALKLKGRLAWRINAGLTILGEGKARRAIRGAPNGTPDLIVHLNGASRFGFLEVKRPGGKLSPDQRAWHEDAAIRGIRCAVVTSVEEALLQISVWDGG